MSNPKISNEELKEALRVGMTTSQIASEYEMNPATVRKRKARLAKQGFSPDHDMTKEVPDGFQVKGVSSYYNKDGHLSAQWVKSQIDHEEQLRILQDALENITSEYPPFLKIDYEGNKVGNEEFTVFPMGDPHIGLMCWAKEVGEDWDLEIAKRVFKNVFERLLSLMPVTDEAIIVNTGDLFHSDNMYGVTTRGNNHLDMDGRQGKWIEAALLIVRMWVDTVLRRYRNVHFVNVIGNHDDMLGRFMGSFITQLYENNPRLTCQVGDNPFQYIHRGKVLLGFAHGHTTKLNNLPGKMADDVSEIWGKTSYRHWITGHVHHNQFIQFKEHPGCSVESVGIIPPKDAYTHGKAYGSRRGTQGLVFNKEHGELSMRRETNVRATD